MTPEQSSLTILLAEDDEGHALLILEQLHSAGVSNEIRRFKGGRPLWDYLAVEGRQTARPDAPRFLLLLDIVMPDMDGLEVLRRIKADRRWQHLPVIMLTTTDDPREIERCYMLGCNCYITKPMEYERFAAALKKLGLSVMIVPTPNLPARDEQGEQQT